MAQACLKLGASLFDADASADGLAGHCDCLDRTAKAQLDPNNYELLSTLAVEVVRNDRLVPRAQVSTKAVIGFGKREGAAGSAVAVLDFTLLAYKVASKCTANSK